MQAAIAHRWTANVQCVNLTYSMLLRLCLMFMLCSIGTEFTWIRNLSKYVMMSMQPGRNRHSTQYWMVSKEWLLVTNDTFTERNGKTGSVADFVDRNIVCVLARIQRWTRHATVGTELNTHSHHNEIKHEMCIRAAVQNFRKLLEIRLLFHSIGLDWQSTASPTQWALRIFLASLNLCIWMEMLKMPPHVVAIRIISERLCIQWPVHGGEDFHQNLVCDNCLQFYADGKKRKPQSIEVCDTYKTHGCHTIFSRMTTNVDDW